MSERTFTAKRYDVASGPAGPGFSWGVNHRCEQVALELHEDGSFRFALEDFYNDWGDLVEERILYQGRYEEHPEGILCFATLRTVQRYASDHEMGTKKKDKKSEPIEERLDFRKRGQSELTCPVEHGRLEGVVMSTHVSRHKSKHLRR
jgi:hypothetical protein